MRKLFWCTSCLSILAYSLFPTGEAVAQISWSEEALVSGQLGREQYPNVTIDTVNQRYLFTWVDDRLGGGCPGINLFGSVTNTGLQPLFGPFPMSTGGGAAIRLAFDPANQHYLLPHGIPSCTSLLLNETLVVDLLNSDGGALIRNVQVSSFPRILNFGQELNAAVAFDPSSGRYLVAWTLLRADPRVRTNGAYFRLFEADGTPVGADSLVCGSGLVNDVEYDAVNRRFFILMERSLDTWGAIVNPDGSYFRGCFPISKGTGAYSSSQTSQHLAFDPDDGRYLVVWEELGGEFKGLIDVVAEHLDAAGNIVPGDKRVTLSDGHERNPDAYFDECAGRFVIVWDDTRIFPRTDLFGQIVRTDGRFEGGNFLIPGTSKYRHFPRVAYDRARRQVALTWQDTSHTFAYPDIKARTMRICPATQPPTANPGGPYTVNEGTPVTFDGSASTDPDGTIVSYSWDLDGDGIFGDAFGQTVTRTFGDNLSTTIGLEVTDDSGLTARAFTTLTVNNVPPTASITSVIGECPPPFLFVGDTVFFTGSFADPGWLDVHSPASSWDFGDGQATGAAIIEENAPPDSTGTASGSHVYGSAGSFTVMLSVADDDGGVGTATVAVRISTPQDAIQDIIQFVRNIPDTAIRCTPGTPLCDNRRNTLVNKLQAVIDFLNQGLIQDAINQLETDIRKRTDGCGAGPDPTDWITDCQVQQQLRELIDSLLKKLKGEC